ncbi:unnamed protein product [Arabidopsis lyrata]|uniref:F-box family protein n=1 Tax=Arabidopsis lyrata subsp. lyrata TaxID=81972 RepID=D7L853_ARALL|nr:putative F-box protein At2g04810 [Arabidopsis lyrata subsp. lyrata]EFH59922.1 F-box family protein [Arabidopsis lyrata subsp. lyrata]CAH8261932.1 unnamed protein product [Arabidopsis lyrata]|eukprot:XP_002883663.1 putative F-box protein At2g04810 [Arabidopsis lyrata subsp. lyrata]
MNKKKRQKVPKNGDWSKLCPDVLRKIFETLSSPVDSHRAKIVCSGWYSVWKTCAKRPPCPLRIIHQGDSPTLGKGNRKLVGLFQHRSYCMASSGNWLLMVELRLKFYIYNLLTKERIDLPSMESQILGGQVRFKPGREYFHGYLVGPSRRDKVPFDYEAVEWEKSLAVLWVNDTTGDYVVAWTFIQKYLFSYMKGDGFWRDLNSNGKSLVLFDMACEDSMLYLLTIDHHIKIFNFFGDIFTGKQNRYWGRPFNFVAQPWEYVWKRKMVIRRSGEVLIVLSLKEKVKKEEKLLFYIFKMNLESCKWERVYSIGDEMLSFGRGVTVPLALKDLGDGIKSDSIYFVDEDVWPDHKDHDHRVSNCGVFDIATSKIEWPKKIYCFINKTHWFVRGVAY